MVREMNHIGLRVYDVDAAIRLYRDVLGGAVIRDGKSLDGKSRFVYIQLGGSVLELITANGVSDQGFAHIAFLTDHDGLDAAYSKLSSEGYFFVIPPKVAASGDGRLAFFRDDSAITYELIQREEHIRKAPFSTELVRAFRYVTVSIKPEFLQKTDAFYTQELSFQREGEGLYAFGTDHVQVVPGEGRIESITLDVYSLEKARAALEQLGLAVQPTGQGLCATGFGGEKMLLQES